MRIRTRLTFQFAVLVILLFIFSFTIIYTFSHIYRKQAFYERLESKARNTAKLLINVDEINSDLILKMERDNPTSLPYEKINIFNDHDSLIFTTDFKNELIEDSTIIKEIRQKKILEFTQNDYESIGLLFQSQGAKYIVFASAKDINGFKKARNLLLVLVVVFFVNVALIISVGWFFSGRALKPISKVINEVNQITITRLEARLNEGNNKDEIEELAHTFNKLLSRIEKAFIFEKTFIANASHQLRTPLTAITGQLEVALIKKREAESYRNTIESILEDMNNLNKIANNLLILARTSSFEDRSDFKSVRIDEVIWESREEILKQYKDFLIEIIINENITDENQLTIPGNISLLKVAFINLFENAYKYSFDKRIKVEIKYDEKIILKFENSGKGLNVDELESIFDPFYRGKNALDGKGFGIGLSMVNNIIKLHWGIIKVESKKNAITTFIVILPTFNQ